MCTMPSLSLHFSKIASWIAKCHWSPISLKINENKNQKPLFLFSKKSSSSLTTYISYQNGDTLETTSLKPVVNKCLLLAADKKKILAFRSPSPSLTVQHKNTQNWGNEELAHHRTHVLPFLCLKSYVRTVISFQTALISTLMSCSELVKVEYYFIFNYIFKFLNLRKILSRQCSLSLSFPK